MANTDVAYVQDYKPYPKDSDDMAGDYPQLALVPQEDKNPFYEWDHPEYRRSAPPLPP